MGSLQEENISLWVATTPPTAYPPLAGDVTVDVAVIGGGLTGLQTALLLKKSGVRVAVVEAGHVASGTSGYTTAKITSQHGLMYRDLLESIGAERAAIYGAANEAAIGRIDALVAEHDIDCDFRRVPNVVYTEDAARVEDLRAEAEASQRLGLPAAYTEQTELPFPVAAAVRFEEQAMFHPRKYCLGVAMLIPGEGSHLFEQTRATDVQGGTEGKPYEVLTERGTIRAEHVVVATQIPFLDRGGFFAKTHPQRSYLLALEIDGALPDGMYLSADSPTRSVRSHAEDGMSFLLVGGEGHKVGQDPDTRQRYAALESWSREHYAVRSVGYRWSAQDYMPVDGVPYIGKLTGGSDRILTATGFQKWGMTTSMVAGMILTDTILGRENAWSALFDATRLDLQRSAKDFLVENADVAKRFVGDRLDMLTAADISTLAPGEGGIVDAGGTKVAAYRDEHGTIQAVSPRCAHMGCIVSWNTAEKTWDCPCHGSRYTVEGHAIQGPTVADLERRAIGQ